jgi:hypothetical protein
MNRACLGQNKTLREQNHHASSIRPLKITLVRMKRTVFLRFPIATVLILLLAAQINNSFAQTPVSDTLKKSFRLFKDDKIVDISLKFDLATYFRSKPQKDYIDANITIHLSKTDSVTRDIRLRTRGVFRNQYCTFAPIELNFKKTDFGYSDLNNISKLKLQPQCGSGKDKEEYVIREYLAYKLFNALTDTSFRVRLLTVTYLDSKKDRKPIKQYGFFIEPAEMLAKRTGSLLIKAQNLTQKSIIPAVMDRLAIFNYMIGNYDWSLPGQHNILVIKSQVIDPYGRGIAIPHDFDWTGLVNATYAIPAENMGTSSVRERIFGGVCRTKETYMKTLDLFSSKKTEFYRIINEFPYLSNGAKKDMIRYLNEFFDQLEGRRDLILYTLMNSCTKL